ncbi:MAG: aminotransferase class I/II-fold pyridoxal phosphate-dependent enzyme, partial [Pseudomonadota bacterium]
MRASSRSEVDPFIVMDVMDAAARKEATGARVIHMEVGQPGTPAPAGARRALAQAMESGALGYTVALGLPALRARIAALYADWYGIELNPDRVIVTPGASGAFLLAFTGLFEAGERVGLGLPGYPSYRHILTALSLQVEAFPTAPEHRYQPVPEDVPEGLAGLIVASPANPSGTMLSRTALAALVDRARETGAALVSDEIYHGLTYECPAATALSVTDEVVVINSFSKYWAMTGWRIGWMVVPERFVRSIQNMAQNLFICAPHASQVAALGALSEDGEAEAAGHLAAYRENRAQMIATLERLGFTEIAPADGA